MIKAYKIFLPVSVDERLPEENKPAWYHVMEADGNAYVGWWDNGFHHCIKPTHWLEEQRNVIVLTEAELEEEKKKEVIAALEFVKNGYGTVLDKKLNAVWQSFQDQSPLYTTEQLYSIFKTKQ